MRNTTIPAYIYTQYQDDDAIWAFFDSFNKMAQEYVDFFNSLNLPVYTGLPGTLLDWVAQGIYGLSRPSIPVGLLYNIGPYNTWAFNTIPLNMQVQEGTQTFVTLNDDYYKRYLTWHHYRGDGKQLSIPWLKRRVGRWLYGINGTDFDIGNLDSISIVSAAGVFTITITSDASTITAAQLLQAAVASSIVELPFQYTFTVVVV